MRALRPGRFAQSCRDGWMHARDALAPFADKAEADFDAQLDDGIARLLPVLGPVLGLFVVLFGMWDAWIDADRAATTLRVRVALVLLGAPAYAHGRLRWSVPVRCVAVYATHAGAMAVSAALLRDGLLLALPALTGALFVLALVEPRPRRWLATALSSLLLFIGLAGLALSGPALLDSVLLYALSIPLAGGVALVTLALRRRAFAAEQALLDATRHDNLTRALSRGYVTELALHDVALARRHGRRLAVAMLDIDHFKRVNDTHGHAAGDLVLRAVVDTSRRCLRATDYLGRVGGEEFVCVMPEASAADALACAERIRGAVAALHVPTAAGTLRVTVSLGVAVLDREDGTWEALLRQADAALYRAKNAGRDRIVLAAP
ncbi:diguanylate cyclase [Massilia sp. NEAU-DD11]|uniref:diguanylate cyclase n=1 Tax=Massilia cellulosiltytica TaxID=2683234 RepID=A0A7X3FZ83_9BURK|nr:diguanylate cyclase [Telluria cellulosilytica]